MRSPRHPFLFAGVVLFIALLLAGCSQEKDAFLNRTFHRLTARDNGWFNANEKLNEVILGIEDAHVDNYDEVLPLFVYGTETQARNAVPDLEKCIDKCEVVIERHSMDIAGKEKNTWIDDAWFVIAKSQLYKRNYYEAERGFTYIGRRFKDENQNLPAKVWLARTAIQLEHFGKAQSALDEVRDVKKLPKGFDHGELSAVQAELDLKRGKVDDAIVHLEHAVSVTKHKRDRVRWAFILAQLYAVKGHEDKAIQQYAAVVRMGPPYEMAFHAQIFQALAFNKGNSKALRQKLNRMLRDDKHVDHFDMIHYALADLDLKEGLDSSAIAHLKTSAQVSTTDTKQKAKTFLKLADIYFDDRNYTSAQQYYDSTRALLSDEHVRYDEVNTRAEVLTDLVEQLHIIALEDSLQALAALDEDELQKRIRQMVRQREREEEEKERLEQEARQRLEEDPMAGRSGRNERPAGGSGGWYFYDPQQIGRGLTQFRKRWGNRPLEDDWRRKDKSGSALADVTVDDPDKDGTAEKAPPKEKGKEEWRDPSYYTKDLPKDAQAIEASNGRICAALYTSGMIYKEKLKDQDNAIESFEVLNNRFDDCRYTPEAHYQLYRIYLEKEAAGWVDLMGGSGSQLYASIILERWPDSEFARLVRDPNVLQADEARRAAEEEAYKEVYERYRQHLYSSVIVSANNVLQNEPQNHFLAKYHMLRAMAIGSMRDANGFRDALTAITTLFPGTEEAAAAAKILGALGGETTSAPAEEAPKKPGPASGGYANETGKHSFVMIVPNAGNDMNTLKSTISSFNTTYLPGERLTVTNSFLDAEHQVILVNMFDTKERAMEYYNLFVANTDLLVGVNDQGFATFAIGTANYAQLYRNKDVEGYAAFFTQNYLDRQ
jgi:tetratricopeptide (TPR) repeat protein